MCVIITVGHLVTMLPLTIRVEKGVLLMKDIKFTLKFPNAIDLDDVLMQVLPISKDLNLERKITTESTAFFQGQEGEKMVINSDNFVYQLSKPSIQDAEVKTLAQNIRSVLSAIPSLDESACQLRLVRTHLTNEDMLQKMKVRDNYSRNSDDIFGTGQRYMIRRDSLLCDFKAEPYIQSPKHLFFEANYYFKFENNIDVGEEINRLTDDFSIRVSDFIKCL